MDRIGAIRVLRLRLGLELAEARDIVLGAPIVVKDRIPRREAEIIMWQLQAVMAQAEMVAAPR